MNGQYDPDEEKPESAFDIIPAYYSQGSSPVKRNFKVPIIVFCVLGLLVALVIVLVVVSKKVGVSADTSPQYTGDLIEDESNGPVVEYITIKGNQYRTSLKKLEISNSGLTNEDIVSLAYMTRLIELELSGNQISDISPLSGLTSLTELFLFDNQISDITPTSSLTSLTMLYLFDNQISDISALSSLTNLSDLNLAGNQIRDITPLSGLLNLTQLDLIDNHISDWSPVAHVSIVYGRPG